MKKSLIIGASSLVFAAAPVFGVFAANPSAVQDTLTVTVDEICTFTRNSGGSGATISNSMTAGALNANFGSNTFKAVCNAGSGYSVAAAFTALTGSVSGSITYSATTPTAGSGTWTATKGGSSSTTNLAASNAKLIDKSGPDTSSGTSQQVTYKVSTQNDIAQGTYTGTATYTLTQK